MNTKTICFLVFTLCFSFTQSQTIFSGVLVEQETNEPISDALIILNENMDFTSSDSLGIFNFTLKSGVPKLNLEIRNVSCHHTIEYTITGNIPDTIKILCPPFSLEEVVITFTDPRLIILDAVKKIPQNYFDSTFAVKAFYRHYQNINSNFTNLTEAQTSVLFRLSQKRNTIAADEAVAVQAIRRSDRYILPEEFHGDDYKDMLDQNPIYHLFTSSLNPEKLNDCEFSISPLSNDSLWVIYYTLKNYSSENHGISGFYPNDFYGEADETGTYIIDKKTLAFLSIERKALRNYKYDYPKFNNFLYPNNNYTGEFIDGYLLVNFQQTNGKYYPKQILHSYTNEFFATITYERAYRITDYFEWFGGEPTTIVSKETMQQFIDYRTIRECNAAYYPEQWAIPLPEFYHIPESEIFKQLEKVRLLNLQYNQNSKN